MDRQEILTYEDYLALPEMMQRYEIIDGELIMPPAPLIGHQWRSSRIYKELDNYVDAHRLGVVLYAPVDVMISKSPLKTRQPDVLFISFAQMQRYGLDNIERLPYLEVAPDLVIEIVSPSESAQHVEGKLVDYQRIGVQECWLVRSPVETIEVVQFAGGVSRTVNTFGRGQRIQSSVLPNWQPTVDALLAPLGSIKTPSSAGGQT